MTKRAKVYGFPNGMVCTIDHDTGQQLPEFNGTADDVMWDVLSRLNAAGYTEIEMVGQFLVNTHPAAPLDDFTPLQADTAVEAPSPPNTVRGA